MKSLSYLNGIGETSISVTDERLPTVTFNRVPPLYPLDQTNTISTINPTINPGIEIKEIINPSIANVRYQVKIVTGSTPLLTGSTISWASLPSGVTLDTVGDTYTLSGITTIAHWNAIKSFTWNLPTDRESCPLWYLEVSIIYYNGVTGSEATVKWEAYDPRFYYIAYMNSAFTFALDGGGVKVKLAAAAISDDQSAMTVEGTKVIGLSTQLSSSFFMDAEGDLNPANMFVTASLACTARSSRKAAANLTAQASMPVNLTELVVNMDPRSYTANNKNYIFTTNTPRIGDGDPATTATFTITLNSTLGSFAVGEYNVPTSPWSYSGTLTQVNAIFNQIIFYPTKGTSSNGTFTYTQAKNSVTQNTQTVTLTGTASNFVTTTLTFNSSTTWTPTYEQYLYTVADVLIVGGGGGGTYGGIQVPNSGGGGGGGGVRQIISQAIANQAYTLTVGTGGAGGSYATVLNATSKGKNGTSTTAFTVTSSGGSGGGQNSNNYGGTSGATTTNLGGYNTSTQFGQLSGGGGGAGGVGGNSKYESFSSDPLVPYQHGGYGGLGLQSTITGSYYGGGGGGSGGEYYPITEDSTGIPVGGSSVGGTGGYYNSDIGQVAATAGVANTGSGGGGGNPTTGSKIGGAGADGVIVIKLRT